ncbi:hypothetical protein C8J57DRAFT_1308700 [Mycena rebaudengoi]|nr:hypothetical protein C8J57DRAFT_1308700 [Mycena rebaudengoi]
MAEFDLATHQTRYKETLEKFFPLAEGTRNNFSDQLINYGLSYGRAAAKAYSAYGTQNFLDYAIKSWWFGRQYTLSQDNISSGKTDVKDFQLTKLCQGLTMAGGTFWSIDPDQPNMIGLATGNFLVLSALLAEATRDPMFLQAAEESAQFIHAHLYNIANVVQDSISADESASCAISSTVAPYNSGLMIEGLSILSSIAKNASTQKLLADIITSSIPLMAWQDSNGILRDGGEQFLVSGLGVAYARNVTEPALREDIKAYLAVQFNAVLDLASANGSNIYAGSWKGPPSLTLGGTNQTNALEPLLNAIRLQNDTSSTSPDSPSGPVAARRSKLPLILGVIGGAVALLVLGITIIWLIRVRQRANNRILPIPPSPTTPSRAVSEISPFMERLIPLPVSPIVQRDGKNSGRFNNVDRTQFRLSRKLGNPSVSAGSSNQTKYRVSPPRQAASTPQSADLPTEELVRLLNERLQNHEWDDGEAPPDYNVPDLRR